MPDADAKVRIKEGEEASMLSASFVNEHVLTPLDALSHMEVLPTGSGKLVMKGEKAFLQLTGVGGTISDIIIVFNGTAHYCDITGTIGDPV